MRITRVAHDILIVLCMFATGSYSVKAQVTLLVEPGLVIPNDDMPWALEKFQGNDELIPVHRSSANINGHTGANVAGSLAGSFFYKPRTTTELPGAHARTTLHDLHPYFYLRVTPRPDDDGNPNADTTITGWAILKAVVEKDKRIFQEVRLTQLTNRGKRSEEAVVTELQQLPDGWIKITPKEPLAPGEYALAPLFKGQKMMAAMLFDFVVDPSGENAKDAIQTSTSP